MTYNEVQDMVGNPGVWSADIPGKIRWEEAWGGSDTFADDDAFDVIAFEGTKTVTRESAYKTYSEELTNPTWKDIMAFFNRAIVEVDDWNHIFFEGLWISEDLAEVSAGS